MTYEAGPYSGAVTQEAATAIGIAPWYREFTLADHSRDGGVWLLVAKILNQ